MVYLRKALELVEAGLELLKLKIRHPEQFTASSASLPFPEKCPKQTEKTKDSDFQLEWTDDVIKLLELALSVHRARSINHGKISITAVVNFFFKQFGLKPG
ncbi:MAG: RteC domain-containing protein, partial [Tannerella sp.]|nr:RteC domain-containing protein [Tannerella sp.]